jgi:uncharacterized membrane protein (GlpM family)
LFSKRADGAPVHAGGIILWVIDALILPFVWNRLH